MQLHLKHTLTITVLESQLQLNWVNQLTHHCATVVLVFGLKESLKDKFLSLANKVALALSECVTFNVPLDT